MGLQRVGHKGATFNFTFFLYIYIYIYTHTHTHTYRVRVWVPDQRGRAVIPLKLFPTRR